MNPDDLRKWAKARFGKLMGRRGPLAADLSKDLAAPAERHGPRARDANMAGLGLLAAGTVEPMATGMDLFDIGAGLNRVRKGDIKGGAGQAALGAASLALFGVPSLGVLKRAGEAVDPAEEMVTLRHYGPNVESLDEIDPKYHGTGQIGAEKKRRASQGDAYSNRSYFYLPGAQVEKRFEGKPYVEVQIPRSQLLDEEGFMKYVDQAKVELGTLDQGAIITRAENLAAQDFPFQQFGGVVQGFRPVAINRVRNSDTPDPDDLFGPGKESAGDYLSPTTERPLPEPRLADGAPDFGGKLNRRRQEIQARIADYVQRPDNAAPADQFGRARFLSKHEDVDEEFASNVAQAYGRAQSTPDDPAVREAYEAFANEIEEQYRFVTEDLGIKMEPTMGDPYRGPRGGPSSRLMMEDMLGNNRLQVFSDALDHPLLTPEQNLKFRFIHDVLGHGSFGNSFAARGEENAFRAHAEMFSDRARGAMATETRGQNSWVNYGPNKHLPPAKRPFAEQKAAILPDEFRLVEPTEMPARDRAGVRSREMQRNKGSRAALIEEIEAGLLPDELEKFRGLNKGTKAKLVDAYTKAPSPRAFASAALQGASQRGWYEASGEALAESFGDDAPRFAALLAATSPQKSVQENLKVALRSWANWLDAGRPTDPAQVRGLVDSTLDADLGNAVTALTASPERLLQPELGGLLSGPKVDPFYGNLIGETQRVVNDTHMARGYGTKPGDIGTVSRGMATTAMVRNAAKEIEKLTGTSVDPREVQEMSWAFIRGLTNAGGAEGPQAALGKALKDPSTPLAGGPTLQERVTDSASFGQLFGQPEFREMLERAGAKVPQPRAMKGLPGVDPSMVRDRDLRDIAERIAAAQSGNPFFSLAALGAIPGARGLFNQEEEPAAPGGLFR